jgi:hypothetical protein
VLSRTPGGEGIGLDRALSLVDQPGSYGRGPQGSSAATIIQSVAADIPNLHDAILERVTVDWSNRTAWIHRTRVPQRKVIVVVRGISEVRLDRRDPWGSSDSINSA